MFPKWKIKRMYSGKTADTFAMGFSSVTQSCPTLCDPIDCSMPGFPLYHRLPELAQTDVHWVSDAIQPSHLLSPPSPPALNLSQRWVFPTSRLFASGGHSIGASASVLPMNIQGWFPLGKTGLISLSSKSLLQHHSSKASMLQCSALFMVQLSHLYMTTGKTCSDFRVKGNKICHGFHFFLIYLP